MGILDFFKKDTNKIKMSEAILIETTNRTYLKSLALNICINYIARTISTSEFKVMSDKNSVKDMLYYKLNERPNTDSSASDFWHSIVSTLIMENEVLIIKTDTDDLVIADSFNREERALYDDIFRDVVVKDFTYNRSFLMSEVLYMKYNNERLSSFVDDLYKDYGKLFGQMLDNSMRKNQLRGYFKFSDGGNLSQEVFDRQLAQVEKLTEAFSTKSVAYVPLTEGIELNDLTSNSSIKDESVNDLVKIKRDLIDDVAKMLGIPTNLIHGDVADLENSIKAYTKFCIKPLNKKINNELNAKFFTPDEYLNGNRIKVIGIDRLNPIENAEAADKLVSSSTFRVNEVRDMFDYDPVEGGDKFIITKNYEKDSDASVKGGENE